MQKHCDESSGSDGTVTALSGRVVGEQKGWPAENILNALAKKATAFAHEVDIPQTLIGTNCHRLWLCHFVFGDLEKFPVLSPE